MKKKILIGSLLVLTLLLLMPSIPAIQQNTIEDNLKQELQDKSLHQLKLMDELKLEFNIDKFKSEVPTQSGENLGFMTSYYEFIYLILWILFIIITGVRVTFHLILTTIEVTIDIVQEIINYFKENFLTGNILVGILVLISIFIIQNIPGNILTEIIQLIIAFILILLT